MAERKQPPAHDEAAAQPRGPWREEEKTLGAGTPDQDAGAAGEASTKARPHDERARMQGAAAEVAGDENRHAPDADTPVIGGRGHQSTGGTATEPEPEDPQAPRNPA